MDCGTRDVAGQGEGIFVTPASMPKVERYRAYLLLIAHEMMGPDLRGKLGVSDLVQETFLAAQIHLPAFRGTAPSDMRAWLRTILERRLSNIRRSYLKTKKRNAVREVSLDRVDPAGMRDRIDVPCPAPSPSNHAIGREMAASLELAMGRLPERYQRAIELRNKQNLSFREVGERMGCTEEAARKLWGRAILDLKERLGTDR